MLMYRNRILGLVFGLVMLSVPAIRAQWHDQGFITSSGDRIFVFDMMGGVRSTLVSPVHGDIYDITMDVDNRQVLLVMRNQQKIVRFDPVSMSITGTLHAGAPLLKPEGITIDHNGDYYIPDSGLMKIQRLDRHGAMKLVYFNNWNWDRLEGGIRIDPDNTDLLAMNTSRISDYLFRVPRDGSSVNTVGKSFKGRYGFDVHLPSWDIYTTSCCSPFAAPIKVLRLGQNIPVDFALSQRYFAGAYCLKCDRASAKDQRLVVAPVHEKGGIWFVDLTSRVATSLAVVGTSMVALDFLYGRNVQPVQTAKGKWDIQLSFPGQAGNSYFVVASMTGNRPNILLEDGRKINLVVDNLAMLTLFSEFWRVFWNNHGYLDAVGEARAHIDVNSIASTVQGVRMYIQAITFNPAAPLGIQTIADPVPFVVEGY